MLKAKPLSAAEKQRRFRERQKSERAWMREALLRSQVEVAKLKVAQDDGIKERGVG